MVVLYLILHLEAVSAGTFPEGDGKENKQFKEQFGPQDISAAELNTPFSGHRSPLKHGGNGFARWTGKHLVRPLFHSSPLCFRKTEKPLLLKQGGGKIRANRIDLPAGKCWAELDGQSCAVQSWGSSSWGELSEPVEGRNEIVIGGTARHVFALCTTPGVQGHHAGSTHFQLTALVVPDLAS